MKRKLVIIPFMGVTLSGCLFGGGEPTPIVSAPSPQPVTTLQSLAAEAVAAQQELAEIRNSLSPERHSTVNIATPELRRVITKGSFHGPLSDIAEAVAREAGYSVIELGGPKTVIVKARWDEPITVIDALADLGVQAGVLANVEVDPNLARVVIVYD